ncbi:hypothetical protein GCM10025862_32590 [Arsenicicoccus piscis]|uniref:Uncharacterized protein n=1 Tax=Arsenicicoccus piscis TaxID=673954 RepID=A0ABQ6HRY2_9MICO|nr:hypothetical protein GCM10025862_32590 [Arsenicicoccus piscis]
MRRSRARAALESGTRAHRVLTGVAEVAGLRWPREAPRRDAPPPLRAVLGSLLGTAPLGRLLLLVLVVALALAVGSGPIVGSPPHAVAAPRPSAVATEPVVVIGAGGLRWEQLTPETMPHLWGLLRTGQSADLVVRAADDPTCLADGWLTLGAGDRAAAPRTGGSCAAIPSGGAGTVAGWSTYRAAAAANRQDAVLGSLADTLAARQSCVLAIDPRHGWVPRPAPARSRSTHDCPTPTSGRV